MRYAAKTHHLYYTATAKKLFLRVPVDPGTHEPAGEPELVVAGRMGDDFCIDEENEVIYLTTHRQNTIDRVSMDPGKNSGFTQSVAGDPFTEQLIGPSSGAWGRGPGEWPGRTAYFPDRWRHRLAAPGRAASRHVAPDGVPDRGEIVDAGDEHPDENRGLLRIACVFAVVGGYLDAYAYLAPRPCVRQRTDGQRGFPGD